MHNSGKSIIKYCSRYAFIPVVINS